jgi:O-antigen/teichoic acid export membrane protein
VGKLSQIPLHGDNMAPAGARPAPRASSRLRGFRPLTSSALARNSTYLMLATGVNLALGYVYWVIAARLYTPDEVGVAAAVIAAFSLAWVVSSLGIGNFVVQTMSHRTSGREWASTLNAAVIAACAAGLLAGAVLVAAGLALGDRAGLPAREPLYILAFAVGLLATIATDVSDKAFIGEQRTERLLVRNLVFSAGKVLLLAVPVFASANALGLAWSWILACLASTLVSIWLLRGLKRGYRVSARGTGALVRPTLRRSGGHHMVSVGNLAPGYLLPLLVAGMLSATQSAYFYTTWRVGAVFFIISAAVGTSLFADASRPGADLQRSLRSSVKLIVLLLVPAVAVCAVAGKPILGILGEEYANHGYGLLLIMVVAAVPDAVTNVYVAVLRARHRLRFAALLTNGMAVASVLFAALLVGPYGIAGAGAGWLIGQTLGAIAVGADSVLQRRRALEVGTAAPADPAVLG